MSRKTLATACALACLLIVPSSAAAAQPGSVTQLAPPAGCLEANPTDASTCGGALGLRAVGSTAISPDGKNVYATPSAGSFGSLTAFKRAPDGSLEQVDDPGTAGVTEGCLDGNGVDGCVAARGLHDPATVTVSPDGLRVYVGTYYYATIAVFARNPADGALTQLAGEAGCLEPAFTGFGEGCATGTRDLSALVDLAITSDGTTLYAAGAGSGSVLGFDRAADGHLVERTDDGFCVDAQGDTGCRTARGIGSPQALALSPRDDNLYVAAGGTIGILSRTTSGPDRGKLAQAADEEGCVGPVDSQRCEGVAHLGYSRSLVVSPDGEDLYSAGSDGLTALERRADGSLRAHAGRNACWTYYDAGTDCKRAKGIYDSASVALSPDGDTLYVAGSVENAIVAFERRPSGILRPLAGHAACDSRLGWPEATLPEYAARGVCEVVSQLNLYYGGQSLAVSPNGETLYAAAGESSALLSFGRQPSGGPNAADRMSWDLAEDFGTTNPAGDRHGNSNVWSYREFPGADPDAGDRNEASYALLTAHSANDSVASWARDAALQPRVELYDGSWPTTQPSSDAASVIGWKSPVSATVNVAGMLNPQSRYCGDGVRWHLDKNGGASLASGTIDSSPAGAPYDDAQFFDQNVAVAAGDDLWLVLARHGTDSSCDQTDVDLRITGPLDGGLQTRITAGAKTLTNDSTPTFEFDSNLGTAPSEAFDCRVDAAAFAACTTPHTTATLTDGAHTFEVRAKDTIPNPAVLDPSPARRTFTVDAVAPTVNVSGGPSGATRDDSPDFTFAASEPGSRLYCKLDAAAFERCDSPKEYSGLTEAAHEFRVKARDRAGNEGPETVRNFTVSSGPDTQQAGALSQVTGLTGCVAESPLLSGGDECADGHSLSNATGLAVFGNQIYATAANALLIFDRGAQGGITQRAGDAGCLYRFTSADCVDDVVGLLTPLSVVVSPDGKHVYVAGYSDSAIAIFNRAADGSLTPAGCVSQTGANGCATARTLANPSQLAIDSTGAHLYAVAEGAGAVVVLNRNATTGALSEPAGADGCYSTLGANDDCRHARGMSSPVEVAISHDNANVYVGAAGSQGVATFKVQPDGSLRQLGGEDGCISETNADDCFDAQALSSARALDVSPDGQNVYVANAGGVAILDRDETTGALSQDQGADGCIQSANTGGVCRQARGINTGGVEVAVSPDGRNVYTLDPNADESIAVLKRDTDGHLTQLTGQDACWSATGDLSGITGTCRDGRGLRTWYHNEIAFDASGGNLYMTGYDEGTVAAFRRNLPTSANEPQRQEWDAYEDFDPSGASNHTADRYGNANVWAYSKGTGHDPSSYSDLSTFEAGRLGWWALGWFDSEGSGWLGAGRAISAPRYLVTPEQAADGGESIVTRWRDPLPGTNTFDLSLLVEDALNCGGDGVDWFVDKGSVPVASGGLDNAARGQAQDVQLSIAENEVLYFVIDPRTGNDCDQTYLDVHIEGPPEPQPQTTITGGPRVRTNDSTPSFSFASSQAGTFECRIDGAAFAPCTSGAPRPAIASDGSHTFAVRAKSGSNVLDGTPARRTFVLDTAAPTIDFDSGPTGTTRDPRPTFTFTASESGVRECNVDGGGWVACASPFQTNELADGDHQLKIRASDRAKNLSGEKTRSFRVDTAAASLQPGALAQLAGDRGCVSRTSPLSDAGTCTVDARVDRPTSGAFDSTGRYLYVASRDSKRLTVLERTPADQPGGGRLTPLTGAGYCFDSSGAAGCADARGMDDPYGVTVHGDTVYVASRGDNTVAVFHRNADGSLAQLTGAAGCLRANDTSDGCASMRGFSGPSSVAVSPNGQSAYVAATSGNAVAVLDRAADGSLTQPAGAAGCLQLSGSEGCAGTDTFNGPTAIVVSPDNTNVYIAAAGAQAVLSFTRAANGTLTRIGRDNGCIRQGSTFENCASGRLIGTPRALAISPDGEDVYSVSDSAFGSGTGFAVLHREADGGLSQEDGQRGCGENFNGGFGCADITGTYRPSGVVVSPDGRSVYLTSSESGLSSFARSEDGSLRQLTGVDACYSSNGDAVGESAGRCRDGKALDDDAEGNGIVVSPDGANVYALSEVDDAIAAFARRAPQPASQPDDMVWDAAADFVQGDPGANPAPNQYGSGDAWFYKYGPTGNGLATTRDPLTYTLMPDFHDRTWFSTGSTPPYWGITSGNTRLDTHPRSQPDLNASVLEWRNPTGTTREFNLSGLIEDDNPGCGGDGVQWYVDHGMAEIASGLLLAGGRAQSFDINETIAAGDSIYLTVAPRGDYSCDGTFADLVVTGGPQAGPQTQITGGPRTTTADATPSFTFTGGPSFECKVDAGAFAACTSGHTTSSLSDGAHTFRVRSKNGSAVDPTPASRRFTVDTTPPTTTIESGPDGLTRDRTPTYELSIDPAQAGTRIECRTDSSALADWQTCDSPYTLPELGNGPHTFDVRGVDRWGNAETHKRVALQVDTSPSGLQFGGLTQLPGTAGCVSDTGDGGACADGHGLVGVEDLVISPDGTHAYGASPDTDRLLTFSRTPGGTLTQLAGSDGCLSSVTTDGCGRARALQRPEAVSISPDGGHLYVASRSSAAIAIFTVGADGRLTQPAGENGCVRQASVFEGCGSVRELVPYELAVSPDGQNLYAVNHDGYTVSVLDRNVTTGALTMRAGDDGCLRDDQNPANGCRSVRQLKGPVSIAFAGSHVYFASIDSGSVSAYSRAADGALTQLAGTAGCLRGDGAFGCATARRLTTPQELVASPDGKNLYVADQNEDAIGVYSRNSSTGALSQSSTAAGCWDDDGTGADGNCEDARVGSGVSSLALAPDGKSLYALSTNSNVLSIFRRSTQNGTLQQLSGVDGCWSLDGGSSTEGPSVCRDGKALDFGGAQSLAISPDSASVYAAAQQSNAVAAFSRRVPRPDNLPAIPEWNAAEDFDVNVAATIPSADRYGNSNVWSYLRGNGGTDGAGRDRSGYELFDESPATPGFRKFWRKAGSTEPWAGLTTARSLRVHPATNAPSVVRWRYPGTEETTGEVSLQIADVDASGGDGVRWFLDRNGSQVGTGRLKNGARPQQLDRNVPLQPGDVLELLVYPAGGYDYDSTRVDFNITSAPVTDTAFTAESPNGLINDSTPTFTATSADQGATFECRHFLVGTATLPPFSPCAQPFTVGPLADGSWRVEARSVVGASIDQTPAFRIVKVDTTSPAVTVTAPANNGATNDTTPTFSGAAGNEVEDGDAGDDLEPITVKVWEGSGTSGTPFRTLNTTRGGTSAWSATLLAADALPQGTYTVKAFQDDEAGNAGASAANTFKVDTVAPVVAITSPPQTTPISATNNQTPVITGTAGNEDGGHPLRSADASAIRIRIWTGTSQTGSPDRDYTTTRTATGAFSGAAPPPNLPEGTYTARADQLDAAGNVGNSTGRTFKIDTTPPAITLDQPLANSETRDRTPTFSGIGGASTGSTDPKESKDDDTLTVRIYPGTTATGTPVQSMTVGHDALGAYTVDAASDLADGTYTARTFQNDGAGNIGQSNTRTFEVDRTGPVVSVTAPPNDTNDPTPDVSGVAGTLDGTAADSVADQGQITIRIFAGTSTSGSPLQTFSTTRNATTGAYSAPVPAPLPDETYTAQVEQQDTLTNTTLQTKRFKVDTVDPVGLDVDEPTQDFDTQGTVHFAGSAANEDGTHVQRSADSQTVKVNIYSGTDTTGSLVRTFDTTRSGTSWSGDLPAAQALTTGRYAVQAVQNDAAGNSTESNVRRFRVDVTPPVLTLTAPAQNLDTNDTTPLLTGTAGTADGSGLPAPELAAVRVKIYSGIGVTGTLVDTVNTTRDVTTGAFSVSPASALAEGTYTAQADQLDNAGNRGFSNVRTFKVDITAPAPTVAPEGDTNDNTPNLSGTAGDETGSHVQRSPDASSLTVKVWSGTGTSGTADRTLTATRSGGNWNIDVTPALADGTWTAVATQTDNAGNAGDSPPRTFKVDTAAPAVTVTQPAAGADLKDNTPTVSGTAGDEPGSHPARSADGAAVTLQVFSGADTTGTPIRTLSVSRTGTGWTTDLATLADGTYTVRAQQTDNAGNVGTSTARTFKIDTAAPAVAITAPAAGLDTDDDTPAISGTAGDEDGSHPARSADAAGVTVRIYSGSTTAGSPVRTLTATRSGSAWTLDASPALADGTYTVQATQDDAAGNTGLSNVRTFKVDTVDPAPTVDSEPDTNDTTPNLSGSAGDENGSHPARSADDAQLTVKVWSGTGTSGTPDRTVTATRSGASWNVDVTPALGEGTWTARAEQRDNAGNTGTSNTTTFKVDTTAPAPTVAPEGDTNDTTPNLSGGAGTEDGAHPARTTDGSAITVRVWTGTSTSGPADRTLTATRSGGSWNADVTPALVEGTYTAIVSQGDGAGNTGSSSPMTFKVDITAPAPTLDPEPDTNDTTPNLSGTAGTENGSHVQRSADSATVTVKLWSGSTATGAPDRTLTVARSGGNWNTDVTPALAEGTWTARAEQTDNAGNSGESGTRTFKVDTTAPAPTVAAEGDTNDATPNLSGTAGNEDGSHPARTADNASVTVRVWSGTNTSGSAARTVTATRSGSAWNVDVAPTLPDGTWTAIASQGDGAGNTGSSSPMTFKVDTVSPQPALTSPPAVTNDDTPTLTGTAGTNDGSAADQSADATSVSVKVWAGTDTSGTPLIDVTRPVGAGGAWSHDVTSDLADGTYTVRVRQTDAAGNAGVDTDAFKVDTAAPAPTVDAEPDTNDTTPNLSGTAGDETGTHPARSADGIPVTVRVWSGTDTSGPADRTLSAPRAGAAWNIDVTPALGEGTWTVRAEQSDAAGNTGTSSTRTFKVDTTAPAPTLDPVADPDNESRPTFTGTAGTEAGSHPARTPDAGSVTVKVWSGTSASGTPARTLNATVTGGAYSVRIPAGSELADGTWTARTEQGDGAGNTGTSGTRTFKVDTVAPAPAVTPKGDTNDSTPNLSGTAGDEPGSHPARSADASSVTVKVWSGTSTSGTADRTLTATRSGGAWNVDVTPALADGTWTAIATQTDAAGNSGDSAPRTFKVDTAAPSVAVSQPAAGADLRDDTPTVSGSAANEDGTHAARSADGSTVTLKVWSGTNTAVAPLRTVSVARSGASWTTDLATLADGTYTVRAEQSDNAGNTGTSSERTFKIDTVSPAVAITSPAAGLDTNDATPAISGTAGAEDGSHLARSADDAAVTVRVYSGSTTAGSPVRTLSATRSGSGWTVDASPVLADGTYTTQATQGDGAGNTGTSNARTFKVDTAAPAPTVDAEPDTNDTTPNLSGGAGTENGSHVARSADGATLTVKVWSGTGTSGTPDRTLTATRSGGVWNADVTPALAEGTWTARAEQSDAAGNAGTSGTRTFKVDTTAPAPTLDPIADPDDENRPTLTGTAGTEGGSHPARTADDGSVTVKVWSGTSASGTPARTLTATVSAGAYSVRIPAGSELADGTWTARTDQSDAAGNSGTSGTRTFKVDTVAPAPSITAPASGTDTSDPTPTVTGVAGTENGSHVARSADGATVAVEVFDGATATGTPIRTLSATRTGASWQVDVTPALPEGRYTLRASQSDAAGNTGRSATPTFRVDTTAPSVAITAPAAGADTNDTTPAISGTASGADGTGVASADSQSVTVDVYSGASASGTPVRTVTATRSGNNWAIDVTPALAAGTYTARAHQSDAAGNSGTSSPRTFKVDTTNPAATLTAPPAVTNDGTPTLAGTAGTQDGTSATESADAASVTVKVWAGTTTSGTPVVDVTRPVGAGGTWSHDVTTTLADGTYTVRVRQTDAAGNAGEDTDTFKVDTAAPAPTADAEADTNDTTPNLSGGAGTEDGSHAARSADSATVIVKVWSGSTATGTPARTLTVTRSGAGWNADVSPALAEGTWTARAEQSDAAGNTGTSSTRTFKVDTTAPAPTIAPEGDTNDSTPNLSGTAGTEDGSHPARTPDNASVTVRVWSGTNTTGAPARTITATRSGGAWNVDVTPSLADGTWTAIASQGDAAGNSGDSAARTFKVDTVAPAPTLTAPPAVTNDATPTLAGTGGRNDGSGANQSADASSVGVKVWAGTSTAGTPLVDVSRPVAAAGTWSYDVPTGLADGTYTVRVTQTDAAGNSGEDTDAFKVDTAAPAPTVDAEADTNDTTPNLSGDAGTEDGSHSARSTDSATVTVKVWSGTAASGSPARTLTATRSGGRWNADVTPALGEGTWTARAEQSDAAGNTGTSGTRTFKVDTAAPAPTVAAEPDANDTTPNLSGTAGSEDGSHAARTADGASVTVKVWSGTNTSGSPARTLTVARSAGAWNVDVTPALAEGTWTAVASQDDGAGNTGSSAPRTFRIDTTAPAPTVEPEGDTNDTTPNLSGNAGNATGDDAALTVKVWSGTSTSGPADRTLAVTRTGGTWNADVTPALGEGTWTAIASQGDTAGNSGSSAPRTFRVDTTAPALTLAPEPDTSDATPNLSGTAGDAASVTVKVWSGTSTSGAPARTMTATRAGSAWNVDVTPALANGTWTARAEQSDAAGNTGLSAPDTFDVDSVAPTVALTAPADGAETNDTTPTIAGTAGTVGDTRSADGTTVTVRVWRGTNTQATPHRTLTATRTGGTWSVDVTPALEQGDYTVGAVQGDGASNTGTSATRHFRVDTTAPSVTVTSPADGTGTLDTTPALTGTAGSAQADGEKVQLKLWSGAAAVGAPAHSLEVTRAGAAWSTDAPALAVGTWTLVASQGDRAGNLGAATRTFTIVKPDDGGPKPDTTPPVLTLGRLPGAKALSLSAFKTGRFSFTMSANEDATVLGELLLDAKTAKKLGLKLKATSAGARVVADGSAKKYVVLSKGQARLTANRSGKLALKLSTATRKKLAKARKLAFVLRLTARDAAGNKQVTRKSLKATRPRKP